MLYKIRSISDHGEFPSVYVWPRQPGARKLHPYNFIALIQVSFKIHQELFAHSAFVRNNSQFEVHDGNDGVNN